MRRLITALTAAGLVAGALIAGAGAASASPVGTEISTHETPFGVALVVGSGKFAGFSLYDITSDNSPASFGCTTTILHLGGGAPPLSCTGPEGDMSAVWPAILAHGVPVAGPGVNPALLGTVFRTGVGDQITYAGHPLYMFDNGPNMVNGEGFQDPATPLPHGTWMLVRPNGLQLPWTPTLSTVVIGGQRVLAVNMITLAGWVKFPAYTRNALCLGACERAWPAVLSQGFPGTTQGAHRFRAGLRFSPYGLQVTYRGQRLYLFSQEGLNFGTFLTTGAGNGIAGFHFVRP